MQGEDSPNEYQNINRTCIHINEGGGGGGGGGVKKETLR